MKMKRRSAILLVSAVLLLLALLCTAAFTYAYYLAGITVYTNDGDKTHAKLGMNLSLLFDRLDGVADGTSLKIYAGKDTDGVTDLYYSYSADADWGTAQNPYIISDIRHLQNLSALWGIGYFDDYIKNFDPANPGATDEAIPYFLICEPDGTPVTVNGSGASIKPIGEDTKPFVGYVGGAFIEGNAEVQGKLSDVSVIYNLNVTTTEDKVDVGLFGAVGYLGDTNAALTLDEILENEGIDDLGSVSAERMEELKAKYGETFGSFVGINSTLRDFLLYDVSVTVKDPTWLDTLSALIAGHDLSRTAGENHHLGILAGHVKYTTVQYISVYYSDGETNAFDISHTKAYKSGEYANYYSESGIIGRMYMMNPYINGGYISAPADAGDGTSSGDSGSGGGALTGIGRGYVSAKAVFDSYHNSGALVHYTVPGEGDAVVDFVGMLVLKNGDKYTLQDGTAVNVTPGAGENVLSTSSGSVSFTTTSQNFWGQEVSTETTWPGDFIVLDGGKYYHRGNPNAEVAAAAVDYESGIILRFGKDSEGKDLCTEWVRKRIIFGTQNSDSYYFSDGVFTFALSGMNDTIEETWENGEVDGFYVGANNTTDWREDISKGNKGVVAYIRPITSNTDLAAAAGKPLVIMARTSTYAQDAGVFLMTLNTTTTGTYSTSGTKLNIAGESYVRSLIDAYGNGELSSDDAWNGTSGSTKISTGMTGAQLAQKLQEGLDGTAGGWQAINVGSSANLSQLRQNYKVKTTNTSTKYYIFVENGDYTGLQANASAKSFDVMVTDGDNGVNVSWSTPYLYVEESGRSAVLRSSSGSISNAPTGSIDDIVAKLTVTGSQYGQNVYSYTDSDYDTYTGILLTRTGGNYTLLDGTPVTIAGRTIRPTTPGTYQYKEQTYYFDSYIYRVNNGNGTYSYYYQDGSALTGAPTYTESVNTTSGGKTYVYRKYTGTKVGGGTVTGAYLEQMSYFELSNFAGNMYQYLIYRSEQTGICDSNNYYYDLYCGSSANVLSGKLEDKTKECSFSFNPNGSCNIHYVYNKTGFGRYVYYDESGSGAFTGSVSKTELYVYVLEATQEVKYGRIGFVPADGKTTSGRLSADEYVLWPDYSGSDYTAAIAPTVTADPNYYVVSLDQLPYLETAYWNKTEFSNGWQNGTGSTIIGPSDISKMFSMKEGASFGTTINILNGQLSSDGFITAPVGSMGIEANIPKGCVAFRVNKYSEAGHYVRVLVSVPCTELYRGESGYSLNWDADYYLGLWQVEANGESTVQSFEADDAMYKVELPRSNGYEPGVDINGNDKETGTSVTAAANYVNVYYNMNGTDTSTASGQTAGDGVKDIPDKSTVYRTYLNGGRVLVAYAFRVFDEGVYVIGTVNPDEDVSFPMEIVFFSADATASAGHDGTQGSELGSIDFVYDGTDAASGEEIIITVKDRSGDGGTTDYTHYYYSSLTKYYINNDMAINVNDFNARIRRRATSAAGATLYMDTGGGSETAQELKRYGGTESDTTVVTDSGDTTVTTP